MKSLLCLVLLPALLIGQEFPDLPETVSGLADLRRTYTSEFAVLQRDYKNAKDPAALAAVQDRLMDLTAKVNLLRGRHRQYFEEGSPYDYSDSRQRAYGILGVLIKKHSIYRNSRPKSAVLQRLQNTLRELKELPLPRSLNIGPSEINQIQRVLDKMHEAFVLDSQVG